MVARLILIALCSTLRVSAQQGDNPGETQKLPFPRERIPQIEKRQLEAPIKRGRIYRIVHEERKRLEQVTSRITGPEKPVGTSSQTATPLTPDQQARFETGKELYTIICGACHQPHGNGQAGLAPALRDSEWVVGSEKRLILITLHGVRGPITVNGEEVDLDMPPLSILDDEQISSILTYIRREWGHTADPIDPSTVAKIRAATEDREDAWTAKELLKIP